MTTSIARASRNPILSHPGTELHGPVLTLARSFWLAGAALTLAIFATSIPHFAAELEWVLPRYSSGLAQLGIDPRAFVGYVMALNVAIMMAYTALGLSMFLRRSRDWIVLFVSITMLLFGAGGSVIAHISGQAQPQPGIAAAPAYLGFCFSVIALYIFPDGQFVPRWTRVMAVAIVLWMLSWSFVPTLNPFAISPWLADAAQTAWYATAAISLIYRYSHLHTPIQREQTKWVLYAFSLGVVAWAAYEFFLLIYPLPAELGAGSVLRILTSSTVLALCKLCLPVAFTIAILRHKLWDINLIINRTLVYVPLTGILAGLYSAAMIVFQKLFVAFTGAKSDAAIVITTLVLASTFTPIKNMLQKAADQRLKEAPDPAKGLKALTIHVRSVVEVFDAQQVTWALLDEAVRAFGAIGGAVYLDSGDRMALAHKCGEWQVGSAELNVRLEFEGRCLGMVQLGRRAGGIKYSSGDRELMQSATDEIARALHVALPGAIVSTPASDQA